MHVAVKGRVVRERVVEKDEDEGEAAEKIELGMIEALLRGAG